MYSALLSPSYFTRLPGNSKRSSMTLVIKHATRPFPLTNGWMEVRRSARGGPRRPTQSPAETIDVAVPRADLIKHIVRAIPLVQGLAAANVGRILAFGGIPAIDIAAGNNKRLNLYSIAAAGVPGAASCG